MNKGRLDFFSLLALILLVFSAGSASAQNSTELPANTPPALMQASFLGHHDPASVLNLTVALRLRNIQQLHEFLRALRNPVSPEYLHFLTPQQFDALYGPTADEAGLVVSYLEG